MLLNPPVSSKAKGESECIGFISRTFGSGISPVESPLCIEGHKVPHVIGEPEVIPVSDLGICSSTFTLV